MISEKDRGQLLRMAGNIACGFVSQDNVYDADRVAELSAEIAYKTMLTVDKLIAEKAVEKLAK